MRKKALRKDFYMEIRKTYARFLSIFLIVALGVAFYSGIKATKPDMQLSADKFFDEDNLMDLRILSTIGLTEEDVDKMREVEGVKEVMPAYSADVLHQTEEAQYTLKLLSLPDGINQVTVVTGRMPSSDKECIIDTLLAEKYGYQIGDSIALKSGEEQDLSTTLKQTEFMVVGTGSTPYYLSVERGTSQIGSGVINGFVMIPNNNFSLTVYSEVYATVEGAKELISYQAQYQSKVDEVAKAVKVLVEERTETRYQDMIKGKVNNLPALKSYVLDRESLQAYVEFGQNADRIGAIGEVFPALFFLVAALISLTTMTRMVEEERTQIGTLKALGYSKGSIASKYLLYAALASVGGGIFGSLVGQQLLPTVIINAYKIMYNSLPSILTPINLYYTITAILIACACTVLAALFACYKELFLSAAQLMRPASPKLGKRVLLERIPFIWKNLNFTQKASIRNLIRYKKRFFMTVFGIASCMALLLVGFGLMDSIYAISGNQYENIFTYNGVVGLKENIAQEQKEALYTQLQEEKNVTGYLPVYEASIQIGKGKKEKSVSLIVPMENEKLSDYISIRDRVSKETHTLSTKGKGVVLTEKVANLIGLNVGDAFYIKQNETTQIEVVLEATTENYIMHYAYMSKEIYQTLYAQEMVPNTIFFIEKDTSAEMEEAFGKEVLDNGAAVGVTFTSSAAEGIQDMLGSLNVVVTVLIVSAGLLAFVVLYNLNNININERKRELATIKVLGFFDYELAAYVYRENLMLTVIGTISGVFLGIILHRYVIFTAEIDIMMFGRNISIKSFIYSIVLTCLFSAFVNFVMYFKLRKIDMVESLKSIE